MTHLILHKVRGEPAFDIAEKLLIGDEEGWIIPTSGHRAYPYVEWPLGSVLPAGAVDPDNLKYAIPPDWPDHYQCESGDAPKPNFNIMELVSNLMPKIKRRV